MSYKDTHDAIADAVAQARVLKGTLGLQVGHAMKLLKGKGNPAIIGEMLKGQPCGCEYCYWLERARKNPLLAKSLLEDGIITAEALK